MRTVAGQQAIDVGERLLDPVDVLAALSGSAESSLASGLAGTALLHARLSAVDHTFAAAAIRHWTLAATHVQGHGGGAPGVFGGADGVAASMIIGSAYLPDPQSRHSATAQAARWLSHRALGLAEQYRERMRTGTAGTPWSWYDVTCGLAGIGRVLLAAAVAGHPVAEPGLTAALETLTAIINARHGHRPGWWTPACEHPPAPTIPASGLAITGMAHGIAGPLALLSTAQSSGQSVNGQCAAIRSAAEWLLRWRTTDTWPPHVSGVALDTGSPSPVPGRADAWCYGIPGISRALILAGQATSDARFTEAAAAALTVLEQRPAAEWDVDGPTLCHGYAGVLQSTKNSRHEVATRAASAVMGISDLAHRFLFKHHKDGSVYDHPGFLTGSAGVALALADYGGLLSRAVHTPWDAILLLS